MSFMILALVAVLLAGCGQPYKLRGTPYNPVIPAPEIEGTNLDGQPFRLSTLSGKVKVLFFGYTFCPDVCPLTLANMNGVYNELAENDRGKVAFIFISVDPDRDTPERLAGYVHAFNPAFYGVTVPADALETVKRDYGVFAEKQVLDSQQSAADYLMNHSAFVYVIDERGDLREIFAHTSPKQDIAADISHFLRD
ncbi:MAG: SCO family protein [Caldilineaceae bacterium]|nr:SCO family protein [Caldilineaceae bacterium]